MSQELIDKAKTKEGVIILPNSDDIEHLSPSQINTLNSCEAKWYFRYVEGIKTPPSAALTLGSSYDDAQSTYYTKKIEKDELTVDQVVDAFVTSFDHRKPDTEWTNDENPDEIRSTGIGLVKEYQKVIAPDIEPVSVQKKYQVRFKGVDWELIGFADLETIDGTIKDNKTSKRTPTKRIIKWDSMDTIEQDIWKSLGYSDESWDPERYEISPEHFFQMLSYSIAEKMLNGDQAGNKLRIDYAIKTVKPKIVSAEIPPPTSADLKLFQHVTAHAKIKMDLIKSGELPPMPNRSSYLCSQRWCGYHSVCMQMFGGYVKP